MWTRYIHDIYAETNHSAYRIKLCQCNTTDLIACKVFSFYVSMT